MKWRGMVQETLGWMFNPNTSGVAWRKIWIGSLVWGVWMALGMTIFDVVRGDFDGFREFLVKAAWFTLFNVAISALNYKTGSKKQRKA